MLRRQFTVSALACSALALLGLPRSRHGWILDHPSRHKPNAPPETTNCVTYRTYADAMEWLEPSRPEYQIRRVEFLDPFEWRSRRPIYHNVNGEVVEVPGVLHPQFVISTLTDERRPDRPRVRIVG